MNCFGLLLTLVSIVLSQVSIEMIEAVGHEHLPSYFSTINAALKPGGKAVIQVTQVLICIKWRFNVGRISPM